MLRAIIEPEGKSFPHNPVSRGYHVVYREGQTNHCPGCGRSHWIIGRVSAECGFCATALPLTENTSRGTGTLFRGRHAVSEQANAA